MPSLPTETSTLPSRRKAKPRIGAGCRIGGNRRGRLSWPPQSARLIRMGRSRSSDLASAASSRLLASHPRPRHLALVAQGQGLVEREPSLSLGRDEVCPLRRLRGGGLRGGPGLRAAIARRPG